MLFDFMSKIVNFLRQTYQTLLRGLSSLTKKTKTRLSNPVSETLSRPTPAEPPAPTIINYTPKTIEDFIALINRTPKSVLSKEDRKRIAAVMSFSSREVRDLMILKKDMVFVNEKDLLGPLMLDRLYKSGWTNFPVVDNANHIKGVIHTEALNALEIKKTDRAAKYMEKSVYYLKDTTSLPQVLDEIKRTNSFYFFVINEKEELVGFLTVDLILSFLLAS